MTGMRKFKNPEKLAELKKLLMDGYSYTSIARHYEVDHSTVIWHARKLGIMAEPTRKPGVRLDPEAIPPGKHPPSSRRIILSEPEETKFLDNTVNGERINPGKSYHEYVKAEEERKWKEFIKQNER